MMSRKNTKDSLDIDIEQIIESLPEPKPFFFKRPDSEKLFGISSRTLEDLAMKKRGPIFYRRGKYAIYEVRSFIEWLTENPILTTND